MTEPDCGYENKIAELTAALEETTRQCSHWKKLARSVVITEDDGSREPMPEGWHPPSRDSAEGAGERTFEVSRLEDEGWKPAAVVSGYWIKTKPDHEFVNVCNGDLRKLDEATHVIVSAAPVPSSDGAGERRRWLNDLLKAAEAFRIAMVVSGALGKVSQDNYMNQLRALESALNPFNYRPSGAVAAEPDTDGPCFYCGEQTVRYAGDPGLWPLYFCQPDGTGITRIHHTRCVTSRLAISAPAKLRNC
jgi:hypothetical protein